MRWVSFFVIGMAFFVAGCAETPQPKVITMVNAAAVDAPVLERVRAFAEKELHVPVRVVEQPKLASKSSFQELTTAAQRMKKESDVTLIVLARIEGDTQHLKVESSQGIAVVNVRILEVDDAEKFARRLERQMMRAVAFTFGFDPTPDPFCVTRDYSSLEELDTMGRNFTPPWQDRFAKEAEQRGLIRIVEEVDATGTEAQ
ncbi:MAG: hypothetical protein FJ220_00550 [Kiritimatiellaceae bacterium]|nr:hypothetical protein [Kiritimatiellaceae bacterium]